LTVANVLIVLGLTQSMTTPDLPSMNKPRNIALAIAGVFAVACAMGPSLGLEAHTPFLSGLGDLPTDMTTSLPWVTHNEPENALSIPTWAIHFSSVFEYLFAMNLVWRFSENTNNPTWKGLTWGMLPLHASGICACTYHFFYNPSMLQFLVSMQAGLTLLGNLTCALAAFRIAKSNGWTLDEVNPFPKSSTSPKGLVADGIAAMPLENVQPAKESNTELAVKLVAVTLVASYAMKYGELGLDLPFTPNAPAALALVIGIPAITAFQYYNLSKRGSEQNGEANDSFNPMAWISSFGKNDDGDSPSLSMADVKKYGVAGTVAYVLTELAFWLVAFPVAAFALYQSTGHWPDVINDTTDRAAVLAFIFAGANIARAFVPVRLGAALALAPWVDENLLSKFNKGGENNEAAVEQNETTVVVMEAEQ
jgi:hypothetical protein